MPSLSTPGLIPLSLPPPFACCGISVFPSSTIESARLGSCCPFRLQTPSSTLLVKGLFPFLSAHVLLELSSSPSVASSVISHGCSTVLSFRDMIRLSWGLEMLFGDDIGTWFVCDDEGSGWRERGFTFFFDSARRLVCKADATGWLRTSVLAIRMPVLQSM